MDSSRALPRSAAYPLAPTDLVAFASLLAIAWAIATCPPWTVDDAYITFRQARHLVEHGVYSWDLAERVDACTGLLGPLLIAAGLALGIRPEATADAVGLAGLVAFLWATSRLARRHGGEWAASGTLAALALFAPLAVHTTSGLETMPFAALVALALLALDARRWNLAALALISCSLTRPEGCMLAALGLGAIAWRERRRAALPLALYVVPSACYALWRVLYFGALLPLPATRKSGVWSTWYLYYLKATGGPAFAVPLVALVVVLVIARIYGVRPRLPRVGFAWGVGGAFAFLASILYLRTEPVMDYMARYATGAVLPIVAPALGLAASVGMDAFARTPARPRRLALVAVVALAPFAIGWAVAGYRFAYDYPRNHGETQDQQGEATAAYLAGRLAPGDSIAVVIDAGLIPYRLDVPTVDCGGLGTRAFARNPADVDALFAANPRAIVIASTEWRECVPMHVPGPQVMMDPRFARYHLAERFRTMPSEGLGWAYYYFVYWREGEA